MDVSASLMVRLARAFVRATEPRDIVVRRRGAVAHVTLSRSTQLALMSVVLAGGVWFSHVTMVYLGFQAILDNKNDEIARVSNDNSVLTLRLGAMKNDISDVAGTLKQSHNHIVGLLAQNDRLRTEVDKIKAGLVQSEAKRAEQIRRQAALSQQIANLDRQLTTTEQKSSALTETLDRTKSRLAATLVERSEFAASRDGLKNQVKGLEERIALLRDSQETALKKITQRTVADISRIERVIAKAGLNPAKMLRAVNPEAYNGTGGPFERAALGRKGSADEGETALDHHIAHWEDLQKIASRLPLIAPVDHYRLGSPFGRRKDPINGNLAIHRGVDLSTRSQSPIFAPAMGTVTYRGWKGQYGRFIEIDHGFGIKTRYGHLRLINVRRGQRVELGQKIGQVGSSGRSTGPHVHYEILVNGKQIDPVKFITAGKDVFKG